jgi:hypothetical protein
MLNTDQVAGVQGCTEQQTRPQRWALLRLFAASAWLEPFPQHRPKMGVIINNRSGILSADKSYAVEVLGTLICLDEGAKRYSELVDKAI